LTEWMHEATQQVSMWDQGMTALTMHTMPAAIEDYTMMQTCEDEVVERDAELELETQKAIAAMKDLSATNLTGAENFENIVQQLQLLPRQESLDPDTTRRFYFTLRESTSHSRIRAKAAQFCESTLRATWDTSIGCDAMLDDWRATVGHDGHADHVIEVSRRLTSAATALRTDSHLSFTAEAYPQRSPCLFEGSNEFPTGPVCFDDIDAFITTQLDRCHKLTGLQDILTECKTHVVRALLTSLDLGAIRYTSIVDRAPPDDDDDLWGLFEDSEEGEVANDDNDDVALTHSLESLNTMIRTVVNVEVIPDSILLKVENSFTNHDTSSTSSFESLISLLREIFAGGRITGTVPITKPEVGEVECDLFAEMCECFAKMHDVTSALAFLAYSTSSKLWNTGSQLVPAVYGAIKGLGDVKEPVWSELKAADSQYNAVWATNVGTMKSWWARVRHVVIPFARRTGLMVVAEAGQVECAAAKKAMPPYAHFLNDKVFSRSLTKRHLLDTKVKDLLSTSLETVWQKKLYLCTAYTEFKMRPGLENDKGFRSYVEFMDETYEEVQKVGSIVSALSIVQETPPDEQGILADAMLTKRRGLLPRTLVSALESLKGGIGSAGPPVKRQRISQKSSTHGAGAAGRSVPLGDA